MFAVRHVHSVTGMALNKIIVGCDDHPGSNDAVRFGALLARVVGAELILANVYRGDRAAALDLVAAAERRVPYGTRAEVRAIKCGSPARGLHDLAEIEDADLIVVGKRRDTRGPGTFATGGHCAVAVAPRGFADETDAGLRVIGVAYDATPESRAALDVAAEVALAASAALRLIGVVQRPPKPTTGMMAAWVAAEFDYCAALQGQLESIADELPADLRVQVVLADGDPATTLIDRAAPLSLLVMGSHGRGPVRRALLGSVSAVVVREPPCPVLVVPRGATVRQAAA
jgi:nucleotide-binding universal stress UspA family protein